GLLLSGCVFHNYDRCIWRDYGALAARPRCRPPRRLPRPLLEEAGGRGSVYPHVAFTSGHSRHGGVLWKILYRGGRCVVGDVGPDHFAGADQRGWSVLLSARGGRDLQPPCRHHGIPARVSCACVECDSPGSARCAARMAWCLSRSVPPVSRLSGQPYWALEARAGLDTPFPVTNIRPT